MQRRVARLHVMANGSKEVRVGILAAGSDTNRAGGETRCFVELSADPAVITRGGSTEQRKQCTVVGAFELPTVLRHPHGFARPVTALATLLNDGGSRPGPADVGGSGRPERWEPGPPKLARLL